jgi:hypothetical protein
MIKEFFQTMFQEKIKAIELLELERRHLDAEELRFRYDVEHSEVIYLEELMDKLMENIESWTEGQRRESHILRAQLRKQNRILTSLESLMKANYNYAQGLADRLSRRG